MRKIIAAEYLTLDGVMENPAWTGPYFNDELAQLQHSLLMASDALLLGRVTYEGFAAAWPGVTDENGFAERMNGLPKFVASRTLTTADWNASIIQGDVAAEVTRLKQEPGQNLLIYGSGQLAEHLRQHHLIDEYRLMVHPLLLGSGQRLFREGDGTNLTLTNTVATSTGVLVLTYQLAST
ncbi:dihydrofolate reductase family protein [Hymenobacter sp.]|uniref:dihydrofolate reductase family protein n=1 Tax=Hymenobacter sp. TaxID=1898978 RepID=UPI00286B714E|nr:dihydrofolate reductase family protein [Hymenobacter sp.]